MTVSTVNSRVSYNGDGVTLSPFAAPFYFLQASDLAVYVGGAKLALTTDYSVTGAGNLAGGFVTFVVPPPVGLGNIVIIRDPDQLQNTKYPPNDPFPAAAHETALDKLTMLVQRCRDLLTRAFVFNDADTSGASTAVPSPQAGFLIGWSADGTSLANYANIGGGAALPLPVSVANGGTGAVNAAAARAALGAVPTGLATASGLTMNTSKLLGRSTAAIGAIEELAVGSGLTLAGGTLSVTVPGANRMLNSGFGIDQRVNAAVARADDTYCLDAFYVLTQTASVLVSQQSLQENGSPFNLRLNQNQVAAQRMGVAQILESANCSDLRGQLTSMAARVRISNSQTLRYAILEWTGAADAVTSDVVNDWTSASYTAGNFFLGASLTVSAVGTMTPAANTWADLTTLQATLGNNGNNVILFIWTEQVAAQNVTLDIARWRYAAGAVPSTFRQPDFAEEFVKCQRWFYKTFPLATAPAQNAGRAGDWEITAPSALGGSLGGFELPFAVRMRIAPAIIFYNPSANNASAHDFTNAADRVPTIVDTSDRRIALSFATLANSQIGLHLTADASL